MGMKIILMEFLIIAGSFNKWLDREGIYEDSAEFPVGAYKFLLKPLSFIFPLYKIQHRLA